jgi:hypothetical protein
MRFQGSREGLGRPRPVRVARLPVVAKLGHRLLLAGGDEDRVEPEAAGAARPLGDAPLEHAGAAQFLSGG